MPLAQTSTFTISVFTIKQKPLFDNPAFAVFLIFLKDRLVGRQISYPTLTDCRWHEQRHGVYARPGESHHHSGGYVIRGRKRFA
jgi:hypothetical protein